MRPACRTAAMSSGCSIREGALSEPPPFAMPANWNNTRAWVSSKVGTAPSRARIHTRVVLSWDSTRASGCSDSGRRPTNLAWMAGKFVFYGYSTFAMAMLILLALPETLVKVPREESAKLSLSWPEKVQRDAAAPAQTPARAIDRTLCGLCQYLFRKSVLLQHHTPIRILRPSIYLLFHRSWSLLYQQLSRLCNR